MSFQRNISAVNSINSSNSSLSNASQQILPSTNKFFNAEGSSNFDFNNLGSASNLTITQKYYFFFVGKLFYTLLGKRTVNI